MKTIEDLIAAIQNGIRITISIYELDNLILVEIDGKRFHEDSDEHALVVSAYAYADAEDSKFVAEYETLHTYVLKLSERALSK